MSAYDIRHPVYVRQELVYVCVTGFWEWSSRTDGYVRAEKTSVFGGTSPNSYSQFRGKKIKNRESLNYSYIHDCR
jgi:hypothetical protein